MPEDSGRDGNCPDGKRERMTGNVDDQLCICGASRRRRRRSWICDTECDSTPLLRLSPQSCGMDKKHVMHDLVRERTENPINRQQSMEANFNNSLTSTTMSSHSSQSSHNTLQLTWLKQQHIQMRMHQEWEQREREETERQEREEWEIEMVIMVEQARMEEERRRIMMQRELEERQRREAAEMQLRMEEIQRAQETEGEDEEEEQEMGAGPSVPKKRKMDDKVSFVT